MKVEEVVYRIRSLVAKGIPSVSDSLRPRQAFSAFNTAMLNIIKIDLERKKYNPSEWMYYRLDCIEMIDAPISECACIPSNLCTVRRSKYKIPNLLNFGGSVFIKSVGSLDNSISLDMTESSSAKYRLSNESISSRPFYYLQNNYIYVGNYDKEILTAYIIPSNLSELVEFNTLCPKKSTGSTETGNCSDIYDQDIKYEDGLIHEAIQVAARELVPNHTRPDQDRVPNQSNII